MFKGLLQALVKKISLMDGANNLRADMEVEEIAFTEDEAENCRLVVDAVNNSSDVIWETLGSGNQKHCILFIKSLIDVKVQNRDLIRPLQVMQTQGAGLDKMVKGVAVGQKKKALHLDDAVALLLDGWTLLAVSQIKGFYAFKTSQTPGRGVEKAENQSIVLGPQEAFCESLEANLGLIRKRLKTPFLQVETIKVGALTHTNVAILSIKELTNDRYLQDIRKRIKELQAQIYHLDKAHHHSQLGDIYFQQGKLEKAEACYRAAMERDPQDIDTRAHFGQCLLREKRAAEARPLLEGVIAENPNHEYGYTMMALAETLTALGETDAAMKIWQQV
ncbi:MAG: spore germination protein, partial [Tumebacillaceae bacterium]